MSPQRYRALLSYLPGLAAVVNSFQSPDIQRQVYDDLMLALNGKLESEGAGAETRSSVRSSSLNGSNGEIAHELVDGGSIHTELPRV